MEKPPLGRYFRFGLRDDRSGQVCKKQKAVSININHSLNQPIRKRWGQRLVDVIKYLTVLVFQNLSG